MRKTIALMMAMAMALMLAACGGSSAPAASAPQAGGDAPAAEAAPADDGQTYTLRIGSGTGGKDKQVAWMEAYEVALEEATNGRIDVQCYPACSIGTMAEMVQGVADGSLDAGCFPSNYWSTIFDAASCVDLPGMFPGGSEQLYNILMDQDTLLEEEYVNHGIIPGTWLLFPDRAIISSSPVKSIADLNGKIIWSTPSTVLLKELELLGAVTSTINVGELAPSLQNGTVDGAGTDITLYFSQSLQTMNGNYLLEIPGDAMIAIFAISQHFWNSIPADLQELVKSVAEDTSRNFEEQYLKDQVATAYAVMQEAGMEVTTPDDALKADFAAATASMEQWYLDTYPDAAAAYNDMLERIAADK